MFYALDSNSRDKLVNILEKNVERKKASNSYICLSCKKQVIVNKGPIRQYFSHKSQKINSCLSIPEKTNAELFQAESIVHHLSKQILSKNNKILVPAYNLYSNEEKDLNGEIFKKEQLKVNEKFYEIVPESIKVEEFLQKEKIKPDLLCSIYINDNEIIELIIEVAVTHSCHDSPEKKDKIKINNINCIEIDLENLHEPFANILRYNEEKVTIEQIKQIENKIQNALSDSLRYQVISLNEYFNKESQEELNLTYYNKLKTHNENIKKYRKSIYNHALKDLNLTPINYATKGVVYKCICCDSNVTYNNTNYEHLDYCPFLDGENEDASFLYYERLAYLKVIDYLQHSSSMLLPSQKRISLSKEQLSYLNKNINELNKQINWENENITSINIFNDFSYNIKEIKSITANDISNELSLFILTLEDTHNDRLFKIMFNLNFYTIFPNDLSKDLRYKCNSLNIAYLVNLNCGKITNYIKNNVSEPIYFDIMNFKNWNITNEYITDTEKNILIDIYIRDRKLPIQQELNRQAEQRNIIYSQIDKKINSVLNENDELVDKNMVLDHTEEHYCICCKEELNYFTLSHQNTNNCKIFTNYQISEKITLLLKELSYKIGFKYSNYSSINLDRDECLDKINDSLKLFNEGALILKKSYHMPNQLILKLDLTTVMEDDILVYLDFNMEKNNNLFFNSLNEKEYYVDMEYSPFDNQYLFNFSDLKIIPSLKERKRIIAHITNKFVLKLEEKNKNKSTLDSHLKLLKDKDIAVRTAVNTNSKKQLLKRLLQHKKNKKWNERNNLDLKNKNREKEIYSLILIQKLKNFKTKKTIENNNLNLGNKSSLKNIKCSKVVIKNYALINEFIVNNEIKFIKINKTKSINKLMSLVNIIDKDCIGFDCVPFEDFQPNLFDSKLPYIEKKHIRMILSFPSIEEKENFILNEYYPDEYFFRLLTNTNEEQREIGYAFFLNNKNYLHDIITKPYSAALINTINDCEMNKTINALEFLDAFLALVSLEKDISEINRSIKLLNDNNNFNSLYNKYFSKYNLYNHEDQKSLLNSIMFRSANPEIFWKDYQYISARLSIDFLENDYKENDNIKSLFVLVHRSAKIDNLIKIHDRELVEKIKMKDSKVIMQIFPVKFGKK